MTYKEYHKAAFERWMNYERECYLANTAHMTLLPPDEPPTNYPTVVYPRDALLNFRSAYVLLRNAVADFLDLNPDTMTQMDVILAMAKRHWSENHKDETFE